MLRILSGAAVRRPVLTIMLWAAVLAAGVGAGAGLFSRLTAEVGTVPGSESAVVRERLDAENPVPESITAVVDGAAPPAVADAVTRVRALDGVVSVADPVPSSRTPEVVLISVVLAGGGEAAEEAAGILRGLPAGSVVVSGGPLTMADYNDQAQRDVQRAELISLPVVLVLLLVVFGSLLAAGLPLLVAIVGIGANFGVLYAFSLVTDVSIYAVQVTTMLSMGLAVDYALLLVSRFREERAADPDVHGAVLRSTATAGRTVLFTGLTVAVALAGLVVFPDPFLRSLGLAATGVVLVNMLAAVTLLPAMLSLWGHRIRPAAATGGTVFARIAARVQRRPLLTLLGTAAALVVLALPVAGLSIGNGDARSLPSASDTRRLDAALTRDFPSLTGPDPLFIPAADADRIAAVPGIARVSVADGVVTAHPAERPSDETTQAAVRELRAQGFEVTGTAARLADYRTMLGERAPIAAGLVALGTLALLFAFTGSILLPVKAVLTNLLSIAASLGVVVWVFQEGHFAWLLGSERLDDTNLTVPVLVAAIAFGLSVDYEMFLLSRVRERYLAGDAPDRAVAAGLQQTGRIITSAGLLLVVVFAGFLTGGFAPIKQIGLGLVLAVALDATVVRLLLVPATMTLLGRWNWWAPRPMRALHLRYGLREA
ncbi:RND superfamily putative drug exporter [Catenuloplanes nepalensis]|uniref:RND superfamily putative drug exporter n=1 Tax=Catenuloplanes nepalensis TaxID=587533 RepID=A0ABT9N1B1_9ACTN|nr:MMPL family transporter [Catenuloplanes nepalensis]MDP9797221.1 RND superfamily putative drug exporter [Catenuloplanes nepalensis]